MAWRFIVFVAIDVAIIYLIMSVWFAVLQALLIVFFIWGAIVTFRVLRSVWQGRKD